MCKDDEAKLCLPQIQIQFFFVTGVYTLLGYTHYNLLQRGGKREEKIT